MSLGAPSLGTLVGLGLFATVGLASLLALAVMVEIGWAEGAVCALASAALLAVSLPVALRRSELIEPIWFVVLIVFLGVTAKAFYVLFGPAHRIHHLLLDKQPQDLLLAALLTAAGMLCLSVGYMLGNLHWRIPRLDSLALVRPDPRRLGAVVGALVVVGLFSFVLFTLQMDLSFQSLGDLSTKRVVEIEGSRELGSLGYLRWGAMLIEIAFYLAFAHWAASRARLRLSTGLAMALFGLLAITFPIFTSSRQTVVFLIIRVIVIWIALRGEPKPRYVAALAATGLVLMGSMLAFRRGVTSWEGVREHLKPGELLEMTVGARYFLDLTKTAHVLDAVPEVFDYQYGKSLVTWVVAPIPRAIWPAKPPLGAGNEFGPTIFGTPSNTGVPPAIVGELNYNFGMAGILVGLLAAGVLLRSLWATLRPRFPSPGFVVIYAVIATRLGLGLLSNSVSGSITKLLQEMIPLVLVLWLCSYERRPADLRPTKAA